MNVLPTDTIQKIHRLRDEGVSKRQVSRQLSIDYGTVRKWWDKDARVAQSAEATDLKSVKYGFESHPGYQSTYAYVLGLYLGDGYINIQNQKYQVYKLRIAQESRFADLIAEHITALETLFPRNTVGTFNHTHAKCCDIYVHSKELNQWFPQHGVGAKHTRPIILETWQQKIIQLFPESFIRGLMQTDGSRYIHRQGRYEYVKYNFTNVSKDVVDLLCAACDNLNIPWTIHSRPNTTPNGDKSLYMKYTVTFNRRDAVTQLESIVGPKT